MSKQQNYDLKAQNNEAGEYTLLSNKPLLVVLDRLDELQSNAISNHEDGYGGKPNRYSAFTMDHDNTYFRIVPNS